MTPMQIGLLLLLIGGVWQVWLFINRPEQYEREIQRRNETIGKTANAAASVVRYILKR